MHDREAQRSTLRFSEGREMTDTALTSDQPRWIVACAVSALDERPIVALSRRDRHVILMRDGDRIIATDRVCPHEGADLALGRCIDGKLYCPRHYAWFDLADGKVSPGWTFPGLRLYPCKIVDGQILIAI